MESLVGRQIYFKIGKKEWAKYGVNYFTPNKLYTIIREILGLYYIIDDVGYEILIPLSPKKANHLNDLTVFRLKRLPKIQKKGSLNHG